MFQWTEKFEPQQDWVAFIIILIFALCVHLLKINPHQFKLLVSFWRSNTYFKIYEKEKYVNPLNIFNLTITMISLITITLLSYFFYEKIMMSLLGEISYIIFFLFISSLILIRFFLLKLIFRITNQSEIYSNTIFRSINFYSIISIYSLFFFSIYYYRFPSNNNFLIIIILIILCSAFLSHLSIYIRIIMTNPNRIVYLILYLCTFKISPWLWLYKSIY